MIDHPNRLLSGASLTIAHRLLERGDAVLLSAFFGAKMPVITLLSGNRPNVGLSGCVFLANFSLAGAICGGLRRIAKSADSKEF